MKMKIYLIHHAHTDIGYTDRQEKIEWRHVKYIENVIDILREAESGQKPAWEGYVWNVETLWMLECFLKSSTASYIADFWRYVKNGQIGLSASYLNSTDLQDDEMLRETMGCSMQAARKEGADLSCAMTCDINGYSWGYPSALADAGVKCLLSAVHTHHGYTVCGKKQFPFFWEGPDGQKLLVWQGEHYHFGNEMNLNRLSGQYSYTIRDGLPGQGLSDHEFTRARVFAYVKKLRREGYPFDFCPIQVSGMCTDNSPPNPMIASFVKEWNALYGDEISFEMTTLRRFFDEVEKYAGEIPIHSGDWTDWWADGIGSTPDIVKHYREAVRGYRICCRLDPDAKILDRELLDRARQQLMLYAEHTWGFSSSVSEPSNPEVKTLELRKALYATEAHELVSRCLDRITAHYGETAVILWKDFRIHILNPTGHAVKAVARTALEGLYGHRNFSLADEKTGENYSFQLSSAPRGLEFHIPVKLEPFEEKILVLQEHEKGELDSISMRPCGGSDGVCDLFFDRHQNKDWICTPFEMITPFFHIRYQLPDGIVSIYDKVHNRELLNGKRGESAFQPIYEMTPVRDHPCSERRRMGRNRKAVHTLRDYGKLTDVRVSDFGSVFMRVTLVYQVKGFVKAELLLTAYHDSARLDVDCRFHKESRVEPENVYLAMPFEREDATLYAQKAGCSFRPRIDQLPESCSEFYALQSGFCFVSHEGSVILATPDTPLISMGSLEAHDIRLAGDPMQKNTDAVYSWVMNNFWETNFKASLGGFHQYMYHLLLSNDTDPNACLQEADDVGSGVLTFCSFDKEKEADDRK